VAGHRLLKKKQKGEKIERQKEREPSNVVDLMEALRQSVSAGEGGENVATILPYSLRSSWG
jgi:non-homologous end joining protein Ku